MMKRALHVATLFIAAGALQARAQSQLAVRQVRRIEHFTTDSLASAATVVALRDGHIYVNDIVGRRVLFFDSTLAHSIVVADTTSATANAYGARPGRLIAFRGDSALFIDPTALSMFVLGPAGTIARVMAVPRPSEVSSLIGLTHTPGIDGQNRLVYYDGPIPAPTYWRLGPGDPVTPELRARVNTSVDSGALVAVALDTRRVDTLASVRIPRVRTAIVADAQGGLASIETTPDALPVTDDWAVLTDGSIAIVRGRDLHIDWIGGDGTRTSTPKLPFDWQRLDDTRKEVLIDSAVAVLQGTMDKVMSPRPPSPGATGGSSNSRGGTGRGSTGAAQPPARASNQSTGPGALAPLVAVRPAPSDLADYVPPFAILPGNAGGGAIRADADNELWIRTTAVADGRPVYDVVNRQGRLVDRVQVPAFRTVAGFGPGVVYLAVKDAAGAVHVERARVR
jgi:hypothetical protein